MKQSVMRLSLVLVAIGMLATACGRSIMLSSDSPQYGDEATWRSYNGHGIRMRYPAAWKTNEDPAPPYFLQLTNADSSFVVSFSSWTTDSIAPCTTLMECISSEHYDPGSLKYFMVDGQKAAQRIVQPGYEYENPKRVGAIDVVLTSSRGYSISFEPVTANEQIQLMDQVISTIRFQ